LVLKNGFLRRGNLPGCNPGKGASPRKVDSQSEVKMENLQFGLTLTVVGMGGTLIILYLISLVVKALNKIIPYREKGK
jgi:hypothetical protein